MPDDDGPKPRGKGFDLSKKVGPLPVWAWTALGMAGVYLGWKWYKSKQAASSSTSTSTPVPTSSLPYSGLGSGIGGGYGGGFGFTPQPATGTTTSGTLTTPEGNQTAIPVAPALQGPTSVPLPAIPTGIQPSYLQGLGLTPDQISGVLQPQNQPSVNPNVSPAPTQALPVGATLGPATGTGQRYLSPGPNPFPFTYG
jgi:hypothetical protein